MLIIEGSDCLGKTTLAKNIVRKVSEKGIPVVYSWMTRPNEQLFDFFFAYKQMMNPCAVQDRFHLGGLAYHHNKIDAAHLKIINGWIRSIGGLIVVLYAGNEDWYKDRLEHDERGNLLPIDLMCEGNQFFKEYAAKGDSDFRFNVLPSIKDLKEPFYVKEYDIDEMIAEWIKRRTDVGLGVI